MAMEGYHSVLAKRQRSADELMTNNARSFLVNQNAVGALATTSDSRMTVI